MSARSFGTMVDDISLYLFRDVRSIGPACAIVMGTGRKTRFIDPVCTGLEGN